MNQERIEPETSNVVGVQFGIMGPEEIRKRSVVEITKKVLASWHEMLYKQQNIINRIRIK